MLRNAATNDGVITNLDSDCKQPNAVDLRLDTIHRISDFGGFTLTETKKENHRLVEVNERDGVFTLHKGSYQFETIHKVVIPEGMAGWLIARSTLNRNGVFITSGLYDSGFNNTIGGVMHVMTGNVKIGKGVRIAQFILVDAETAHLYDGQYNETEVVRAGPPRQVPKVKASIWP